MPEIQMPKLSDTMTEGTLVTWKKKKGDKVAVGDVIAEIETDKATMEWESPEDGTLTEIYVEEGGKVNVGDKIAFIASEGESPPAAAGEEKKKPVPEAKEEKEATSKEEKQTEMEKPAATKEKEGDTAPPPESKEEAKQAEREKPSTRAKPAVEAKAEPDGGARVKASPLARRTAAELGIDISAVKGTGPEGRITETDVRAAGKAKGPPKAAAPQISASPGARINLTGMRKVIAERLVASKGPIPHFYLNIEIDAGPLMNARAELKSAGEGAGPAKITVNDFVLKAAVEAAVRVPGANASFDDDAIVQYS